MWSIFANLKRVKEGKREPALCGSCKQAAVFYEVEVRRGFKFDPQHLMQCGECLDTFSMDDFESAVSGKAPDTGKAKASPEPAKNEAGSGAAAASAGTVNTGSSTNSSSTTVTPNTNAGSTNQQQQAGPTFVDFAKGFYKMTESLGAKTKGLMNKLDQMTFNMLIDNLKSNDLQVLFDTIAQLEKEKKPMTIPPLYFVAKNHPVKNVRERASKALANIGDVNKIEKLTEGKSIEEAVKALINEYGHFKG